MPKIPLIGISAAGRSQDLNSHRAVNLMPVVDTAGAKNTLSWVGTPGLKNFCTTSALVRGTHEWDGWVYFVAGTVLYRVQTSGGTPSELATGIVSSTNPVSFANNETQLAFVQGGAYVYVWDGTTLTKVEDWSTEIACTQIVQKGGSGTTFVATAVTHGGAANDKVVFKGTTNFNREYTITAAPTADTFEFVHVNDTDADETGLVDAAAFIRDADDSFVITPTRIVYMDSYFIMNTTTAEDANSIGKMSFMVSYPADGRIWEPADSGAAERDPDNLQTLYALHGDLYLMGDVSTEYYYNAGSGTQPFAPSRGAASPWGCVAPGSVAQVSEGLCWLAKRKNGQISVVYGAGYDVQVVSNAAVEYQLSRYPTTDLDDATAYSYRQEGQDFYCLTFGNSTTGYQTWVFDAMTSRLMGTQAWHERQDYNGSKHRGKFYAYLNGAHLVSDHTESKILEMDRGTYTELVGSTTQSITRTGISGNIFLDDKTVFHHSLVLDVENPTGSGSFTLSWSDDGGNTYSTGVAKSFTTRGTRVEWHQLGSSREGRVYKIVTTAQVPINISGAFVNITEGLW